MESYKTINANYPDFETYLQNLNTLYNFDFSKSSYDEIYNKFHDYALTLQMIGGKLITKNGINKLSYTLSICFI